MAFKVGDHVGGHYRSATWTGRIKPDADSKHPGEPSLIHRFGKNIHKVG